MSLTSCIPAIKASSMVAWVNRGCLGPAVPEIDRAQFSLSFPLRTSISPLSSYVVCFWDLPTSLGFEQALSPVVLSVKFTFNTFSSLLPLTYGDSSGSLSLLLSVVNTAGW